MEKIDASLYTFSELFRVKHIVSVWPTDFSLFDWKGKLLDVWLLLTFNHLIDKGKDIVALDTE